MLNKLSGELRLQHPLAKYTSWQIGGIAKQYYRPIDVADLVNFLQWLPAEEPVFFLGHGSNVLIRDGGFPGTVVHIHNQLNNIGIVEQSANDGVIVCIGAGATCAMLVSFCQQHGLVGSEFYAGIPGTIGGALAMNAGCFGMETWSYVTKVATIDRKGQQFIRDPQEFTVGYRKVVIPNNEWFTAGYLCFHPGDVTIAHQQMKELLALRKQTQPIGELSCGSVFCNPPGLPAAKLIGSAGLKGMTIGKAIVSTKHANFIINQGGASAKNVEDLIKYVQQRVFKRYRIRLTTEVNIIGVKK